MTNMNIYRHITIENCNSDNDLMEYNIAYIHTGIYHKHFEYTTDDQRLDDV